MGVGIFIGLAVYYFPRWLFRGPFLANNTPDSAK